MKKYPVLYIAFCAFFFNSCLLAPTEDSLTKTFSCKVDGMLWIARATGELSPTQSDANMKVFRLGIGFSGRIDASDENQGGILQIVLNNLNDTGLFLLTPSDSNFMGTQFTDINSVKFKAVPGDLSFVRLTQFDTTKFRTASTPQDAILPDVKGSFNIVVQNAAGKIIHITEGKFDLSSNAVFLN